EVCTFAKDGAGQCDRCIGARGGRRPQATRYRERLWRIVWEQSRHLRFRHDGLYNRRQEEPQIQRPKNLPEHRERHPKRVPDAWKQRRHEHFGWDSKPNPIPARFQSQEYHGQDQEAASVSDELAALPQAEWGLAIGFAREV